MQKEYENNQKIAKLLIKNSRMNLLQSKTISGYFALN